MNAERTSGATSVPRTTDFWVISTTAFLVGLGLVMIYSSSAAHSVKTFGSSEHFFVRQLIRMVVGIGCLWICLKIPTHALQRFANW